MKRIITIVIGLIMGTTIFLTSGKWCYAINTTDFYVDGVNGSNINAGDNKSVVTSTNGNWDATNSSFTAASGTPFSGSSVGDFAAVYIDAASSTSYISRITAVNNGGATLVLSNINFGGTAPSTSATGRSCTVGGQWKGPLNTQLFPFGLITPVMVDVSSDITRVNFKNNISSFSLTTTLQYSNGSLTAVTIFQGYSATPGDGGKAIFDWGNTANQMVNLSNGQDTLWADLWFRNNITQPGLSNGGSNGANQVFYRVIVSGAGGNCFSNSNSHIFLQDEAYNCGKSNGANTAGFGPSSGFLWLCNSHDSTGSNVSGYRATGTTIYVNVIGSHNGKYGLEDATTGTNNYVEIIDSDFANNTSDGIALSNTTSNHGIHIANVNLVNNGGYGIHGTTANQRIGVIEKNGFFNNTSGTTNSTNMLEINSFNYASNPYFNMNTGDFRMKNQAGMGTGVGNFTVFGDTISALVSYLNVGAVKNKQFPGGSLVIAH